MVCRGIPRFGRVAGAEVVRSLVCVLAATLILTTGLPAEAQAQEAAGDPYTQGLELLEIGDWLGALRLWDGARQTLGAAGRSDPRIGIAFIETTLEHNAIRYLEPACEMYLWGFSGENLDEHAEAVRAFERALGKRSEPCCVGLREVARGLGIRLVPRRDWRADASDWHWNPNGATVVAPQAQALAKCCMSANWSIDVTTPSSSKSPHVPSAPFISHGKKMSMSVWSTT